jgi:hypothetical protein
VQRVAEHDSANVAFSCSVLCGLCMAKLPDGYHVYRVCNEIEVPKLDEVLAFSASANMHKLTVPALDHGMSQLAHVCPPMQPMQPMHV